MCCQRYGYAVTQALDSGLVSEWPYLIGQCTAVRLRSVHTPQPVRVLTQLVYVGARQLPTQCRAVRMPKVIRAITLQPSVRQSGAVDKAPLQDRALRIGLPRSLKDVLTICAHTLLLTCNTSAVRCLGADYGAPRRAGRSSERSIAGSCRATARARPSPSAVSQAASHNCAHSTACGR